MVKETNISINENRLWDSLMEMAKIGPGIAGGNNRQTVTFEDGEARKILQDYLKNIDHHPEIVNGLAINLFNS